MRTMMMDEQMEKVNGGIGLMIIEQKVTYYDENGNPYTVIVRTEENKQPSKITALPHSAGGFFCAPGSGDAGDICVGFAAGDRRRHQRPLKAYPDPVPSLNQ